MLGGTVVLAAVVAGAALATGVVALVALTAIPFLIGAVAYAKATKRLDVVVGRVVKVTPFGTRSYDAAELTLEPRGDANVFVLAGRGHSRRVVCVIQDADADKVRAAFTAAGVEVVELS